MKKNKTMITDTEPNTHSNGTNTMLTAGADKLTNFEQRITPENINSLSEGQIFVFGSNLSGRHGKGAAKTALGWGAKWGQAKGLQGRTYGIPTKNSTITRTLSVREIEPYVFEFIEFAKANKQLTFLVTEIGCGLAGLKPKDIAPLFKEAVNVFNVHLPSRFWHKLSTCR